MKSKILFIVLSAVALMGCSCGRTVSLTLVQYNVGVFDKYEGSSIESVAGVVKGMGADVVTLNEVDSCALRTGKVDQIAEFAETMGNWSYHYASAMPFNGGAYGIGIAANPSLRVIRTDKVALPKGNGYEPRAMAVVEYEDFIVATVHLDLTPESRMAQIEVVNSYMNAIHTRKPIFLTGDFNAEPDSELISVKKESWKLISPLNKTYPSDVPAKCIDYIFVRPQGAEIVVLEQSDFKTSKELAAASDHLPVMVSVRIN